MNGHAVLSQTYAVLTNVVFSNGPLSNGVLVDGDLGNGAVDVCAAFGKWFVVVRVNGVMVCVDGEEGWVGAVCMYVCMYVCGDDTCVY